MKVELVDIHKHFGPVRANDGISLTLEAGTIHGLLGENGAGKTTLMKVLSGFLMADGGRILLDGRSPSLHTPRQAIAAGVGMLHQDPLDFPPLSVLDNFLLGRPGSLLPDRQQARRELAGLAGQLGFSLAPDAAVATLTVGERQQLEIVRLLCLGVQVLILDEPTTGISANQKASLFAALRALAGQGRTIVFVSHKLEDVQELCDKVTVLRQGKTAGEATIPCSNDPLVAMMFGQAPAVRPRAEVSLGAPAVELHQVSAGDGRVRLSGLDLRVRAGEVIGLAGLEGSGQRLLLRTCAGLLRPSAGRVHLGGKDLAGQPYRRYMAAGVGYLAAGRLEEGLVPGLDLREHVVLAQRPGGGVVVDWPAAQRQTEERIRQYNIKGMPSSRVESLSGGNQQRALLALLPSSLRLLLMEHPTRGLDIESTLWIWQQLLDRRRQGTAILFASADLDELLGYSDRILVFSGGQVTGELRASDATAAQLGERIGGIIEPQAEARRPGAQEVSQ